MFITQQMNIVITAGIANSVVFISSAVAPAITTGQIWPRGTK